MRPITRVAAAAGVFVLTSAPALAGERINDRKFEFELTIPDGFVCVPEANRGDVIYTFQKPPARDGGFGTWIVVSRMRGTLGRDKIDQEMIDKFGKDVTVSKEHWKLKGLEIDVCRVPEAAGDLKIVTFNIQVPLKPEAIQISVSGERADEAELKRIVTELMSNLSGQSNWLTTGERVGKLVTGLTKFGCCCIAPLIAIVVAVVASARKSNKRRRRPRRPRFDEDEDDRSRERDEDDRHDKFRESP